MKNRAVFYFFASSFVILIILILQIKKIKGASDLQVWTYGSFFSDYGPGRELAEAFEKQTGKHIVYNRIDDAGLFLQKLKLIPDQAVDVVINFDQWNVDEAVAELEPQDLNLGDFPFREEVKLYYRPDAAPLDWSPMAFLFHKGAKLPKSWPDLLKNKYFETNQISLMSPVTSSPGWLWLMWLEAQSGVKLPEAMKALKSRTYVLSSDWSGSYGIFQSKKAVGTFTYLTSLIYHWREEKSENFEAAVWPSGHPVQVEYVMVPERAKNPELAKSFVRFLLSEQGQALIRDKNFMMSVRSDMPPTEFEKKLPVVPILPMSQQHKFILDKPNQLEQFQKNWL